MKTIQNYDGLMLTEEKSPVGLESSGMFSISSLIFLKTNKQKISAFMLFLIDSFLKSKKKKKRKKSVFK